MEARGRPVRVHRCARGQHRFLAARWCVMCAPTRLTCTPLLNHARDCLDLDRRFRLHRLKHTYSTLQPTSPSCVLASMSTSNADANGLPSAGATCTTDTGTLAFPPALWCRGHGWLCARTRPAGCTRPEHQRCARASCFSSSHARRCRRTVRRLLVNGAGADLP